MVRLVGIGSHLDPGILSSKPTFLFNKYQVGLTVCYPSEVGKMSASLLVSCVGVVTCPGLCPIAKETALAAPTLCTEYGPDGWMDKFMVKILI